MNNSYNYSDFVDLIHTSDYESGSDHHGSARLHAIESAHQRDETIDSILFSSALADVYYTD